jgi:tetratricopeptide (TPR) repeat protein
MLGKCSEKNVAYSAGAELVATKPSGTSEAEGSRQAHAAMPLPSRMRGQWHMPTLAAALEKHQVGELALAAQLYEQVLAETPDDADALHLLGVLRHQQGDHRQAIELINRALVEKPNVAAFHTNLAEAYRVLGEFERAIGCCRTRRPVRTASVMQVRQPIYGTSVARWRNYEREPADCFACLSSV